MGHEVYGVELDAYARRVAQDAGIPLLGAVIEDVPDAYKASFDLVSLSHVIEHVHDPLKVLKHCHSLLKPGGTLWLETPNLSSYGAQHYGAGWRDLAPPRHLTLFNKNNMAGLLEDAGFADISFHRPKPVWREVYKASELNRRALFPALKTRAASECRLQGRLFAAVIRGRIATIYRPDRGEFMTLTAKRC
jgi:SAM-dependent methyltransferase